MSWLGKTSILFAHSIAGWALCAAIMGIGMKVTTIDRAMVIHAIGAPLGFAAVSVFYFRKFTFTGPLQTAIIFVLIVIGLDVFVVASLIMNSFKMFRSFTGTWLPLILIFLSVYLTGQVIQKANKPRRTTCLLL